jgi:small-conductance mechanosensitive channel
MHASPKRSNVQSAVAIIILLAFLWPAAASAKEAPAQKAAPAAETRARTVEGIPPATLKIQNRTIIVLRGTLLGYTPKQRVDGAEARINAVIEKGGVESVTTHLISEGIQIQINGQVMVTVTPGDVNTLAGETLEDVSERAARNLTKAIEEINETRRAEVILRATGYAVAATVVFVLILLLIRRVFYGLDSRLDKVVGPRVRLLAIRGFTQHIDLLLTSTHGLLKVLAWIAAMFSTYLWITFVFQLFPYTRPWGEGLRDYLLTGFKSILLAFQDFIPGLIVVTVIVIITRFLARLAGLFFDAVERGRVKVPGLFPDTAMPTRRITAVVLWIFAFVMMYPYLPGSDSDAFKGTSVFVGLLISLGATGIVNQAMSGMMLMYARALRTGDYVQIGETVGTVVALGMFSTRIRTPWNEIVSLPNAFIVGTTTKNYSREEETGGALLTTTVTIGYNAPWRQVHAMLTEAADRTEGLLKEPPPLVLQRSLSDYYVEYMLGVRIAKPQTRIAVLDELHRNIQDVFNEYGVQIMSPHYMADPAEKVWVPKENWYEAPAKKDGENR